EVRRDAVLVEPRRKADRVRETTAEDLRLEPWPRLALDGDRRQRSAHHLAEARRGDREPVRTLGLEGEEQTAQARVEWRAHPPARGRGAAPPRPLAPRRVVGAADRAFADEDRRRGAPPAGALHQARALVRVVGDVDLVERDRLALEKRLRRVAIGTVARGVDG